MKAEKIERVRSASGNAMSLELKSSILAALANRWLWGYQTPGRVAKTTMLTCEILRNCATGNEYTFPEEPLSELDDGIGE